jgi:DNA modification methylase
LTSWRILAGDCRASLATLEPGSVQTCVTSPPYFGLRDYGTGTWEGGDAACDHIRTVHENHKDDRPRGWDGPFRNTGEPKLVGYGAECGKCGARRVDQQIGLEPTPDEFVAALVAVFREVRRVLRDDGTVWLNLGDSYSGPPVGSFNGGGFKDKSAASGGRDLTGHAQGGAANKANLPGIKQKDLIGIPWMVAFALRADGWYLRSDIIWSKPNPMPESVTDRPTKSHEYMFLLSKGPRYFYDADAIREPHTTPGVAPGPGGSWEQDEAGRPGADGVRHLRGHEGGRNRRSVWTVATQPFPGAHFATFPPKLIEPCILAGTSERACGQCGAPWERVVERTKMEVTPGPKREAWQAEDDHARTQVGGTMTQPPTSRTVGWKPTCGHDDPTGTCTVLDPFSGSGTTGLVALRHGRSYVGCELNEEYVELSRERIIGDAPLLNSYAEAA